MAEVSYKPVEKILIYEVLHYEFEQFVNNVCKFTNGNPVMKWCEGVLFVSELLPYTPEIINDRTRGILHWNYIEFAYMPKFKSTIVSETNNRSITVVDVSTNTSIVDVCRWLKKQPQWKVPET